MWALCVYVEAVSVLPQLRMMQKAKVVEKFTAHYVFALGLSRFISCAHWILQLVDGNSFLLQVGPAWNARPVSSVGYSCPAERRLYRVSTASQAGLVKGCSY